MTLRIERLAVSDHVPMDWWAPRLVSGRSVRSWIPDSFERYARVLHPAHVKETKGANVRPVRWKEISAWSGRPLHPGSSIDELAVRADGASWLEHEGGSLPLAGQLEQPYFDRLIDFLAEATSTVQTIWLLVWLGYQGAGPTYSRSRWGLRWPPRLFAPRTPPDQSSAIRINPSWDGSGREFILHRGSLGASVDDNNGKLLADKPPSFWWPEDRAWFVSTDIDSTSTYIGGSRTLVDRLLSDDVLEVLSAEPDDPYDGPAQL